MHKKNGFTLIELMAVLMILGAISLITIPTVEKFIKSSKEKLYQSQLDNIVLALKNWAGDNKDLLPTSAGEQLTLNLGILKSEGYVDYDIKNPKNNHCFDNSMLLKIIKVNNYYDYEIDLNSIKEMDSCEVDMHSPKIILNGSSIELVEINSIYNDLGVIAKDSNGNNITNNVTKIITGSGNSVNTTRLNNQYVITYTVSSDGKTVSTSRTVKIVDTTPPELVIPGNTSISTSVTSFNLMTGVSATDNSGESITVSNKSNISFGIKGKYTVTYTAKDSSGNTISKNRIIEIK